MICIRGRKLSKVVYQTISAPYYYISDSCYGCKASDFCS